MKIIVVGGSGFVGSSLVPLLANKYGHANIAYTFNRPRPADDLPDGRAIRFDLRSDDPRLFSSFGVMFFLAGNSSHAVAISEPAVDLERNVLNLLRALREFQGHLILLSSAAVYYGREGDVKEEDAFLSPFPYGASKFVAEHYVRWLYSKGRLVSYRIFRLTYAFGLGERRDRLFAKLRDNIQTGRKIVQVRGKGSSILQPLPVSYVSEILADSIDKPETQNQVFNLCSKESLTVLQAINLAEEIGKVKWDIRFTDPEEYPIRFRCRRDKLDKLFDRHCPSVRASLEKYLLSIP